MKEHLAAARVSFSLRWEPTPIFFIVRVILLISLVLLLSACMPKLEYEMQPAESRLEPFLLIENPDDEILSVFKGAMSDGVLYETLIAEAGTELGSSFYSFGVGKTIAEFGLPKSNKIFDELLVNDRRVATIEWEANIVKHFGEQDNFELNFLIFARWHLTPFEHFFDINFAFGDGLSYASDIPYYESKRWPSSSQLLNNMTFELGFDLPTYQADGIGELSGVVRLHHRSGAFGLFGGVHGASNIVAFGLRARYFKMD